MKVGDLVRNIKTGEFIIFLGETKKCYHFWHHEFKDCYFSFMGFGDGAIYLDRECVFNNIIITNNISMNTSYSSSQIPASTSGYDFGIISNECLYDDISELNGVIETGNISDDQY